MEKKDGQKKNYLRKGLIVCGWLLLWQIVAAVIHNPIYFAGPAESVKELLHQAKEAAFWQAVLGSYVRILAGFLLAASAAYLVAFFAWRFPFAEEVLEPFISFLRSVPVAAVVVVFLIWSGARWLVFYISFMVVFPNLYGNLLTGLRKMDVRMLEMAQVFRIPFGKRLRCIYRPAYLPYLRAGMTFSLGMCFKSGVAAEIIALPEKAIGSRLYMDKIYLNTAGVFAWMAVIVGLSFLTEKWIGALVGIGRIPKVSGKNSSVLCEEGKEIAVRDLKKSYAGERIVSIKELHVAPAERICLLGASGSGKTTLLHLLAGILRADDGRKIDARTAVCFQENRLWEDADAVVNLWLAGCSGNYEEELQKLLPKELCYKPVRLLSGGEKRRVALARAVLAPAEWLLLDEPFTGLDEEKKQRVAAWVLEQQKQRPMLVVTHDEEEVRLLQAKARKLTEER